MEKFPFKNKSTNERTIEVDVGDGRGGKFLLKKKPREWMVMLGKKKILKSIFFLFNSNFLYDGLNI